MHTLNIDIETFSKTDLTKCGVYKYVEDTSFEILLFGYKIDDGPAVVIDLYNGDTIPPEVVAALVDPAILKTAHNANFERTCIAVAFGIVCDPKQWSCTMAKGAILGLPLSLEFAAKALSLAQQKDKEGKALVRFFCIPCKPTKKNNFITRNLPEDNVEKWVAFISYCKQDVVTEAALRDRIDKFSVTATEVRLWQLDQKINDYGISIDQRLVNNVMALDDINRARLTDEAIEITGITNPNSAAQLKNWLAKEMELDELNKLRKQDIGPLRKLANAFKNKNAIHRVLDIRTELSKSSITKYAAMLKYVCADGRIRGMFQYYGANRTGRWAGRGVQLHNLPKNELKTLDLARQLVYKGDIEALDLLYGSIADVLSQLVRTAFVPANGYTFLPADFSAIEARVLAWLADETWRLEVFNTHGKIYEASASQIFRVPIEHVTKGSTHRHKGKLAELALGFGGGVNAIKKIEVQNFGNSAFDFMCLYKSRPEDRIKEIELQPLVDTWRFANKKICKFWRTIEDAAIHAVKYHTVQQIQKGIKLFMQRDILFIELPSGRKLAYLKPRLVPGKYDREALTYVGVDPYTKKYGRVQTWGGKLVENVTQAIARDCLAEKMILLDDADYTIVLHVHDEIVPEEDAVLGSALILAINTIMSSPISWAPGLPLNAESYETLYYKKD